MTPSTKPLYSHALPEIEDWLRTKGAERDNQDISRWTISRQDWSADLYLDVDSIVVNYTGSDGQEVQRSFKYSLSRGDLEKVIFSGP